MLTMVVYKIRDSLVNTVAIRYGHNPAYHCVECSHNFYIQFHEGEAHAQQCLAQLVLSKY